MEDKLLKEIHYLTGKSVIFKKNHGLYRILNKVRMIEHLTLVLFDITKFSSIIR